MNFKQIYIMGGTMGVGKFTVSQVMKEKLNNSVFVDGDWCWDAHPFQVTKETKQMVLPNICFFAQSIHTLFCLSKHYILLGAARAAYNRYNFSKH